MAIQFIYFDLGNVLFEVDHRHAWDQSLTHCDEPIMELMERFYAWGDIIDHMIGNVDDETFFAQMKTLLGFRESAQLLKSFWETAFQPVAHRFNQVEQLASHYKLGALSNISPVHSNYILENVPEMKWLKHPVFSWETGFIKPREEIFNYAEELCDYRPEEILFVDDQQRHVDAAKSLGWHSLCLSLEQDMFEEIRNYIENHTE